MEKNNFSDEGKEKFKKLNVVTKNNYILSPSIKNKEENDNFYQTSNNSIEAHSVIIDQKHKNININNNLENDENNIDLDINKYQHETFMINDMDIYKNYRIYFPQNNIENLLKIINKRRKTIRSSPKISSSKKKSHFNQLI